MKGIDPVPFDRAVGNKFCQEIILGRSGWKDYIDFV